MIKGVGSDGIKSTSSSNNSYTIKPGDTMSDIAKRQGVGLSDLIKANPQIKNPNLIFRI